MIYGINEHALSYGEDSDFVQEFKDQAAAQEAFRHYIRTVSDGGQLRFESLVQLYLFRTYEDAEAANQSTEDEVLIDETKAFRTLEWERGFGFNF
jgi:hypothetical protein